MSGVRRSTNSQPYHSQASDSPPVPSEASTQRRTRSTDSRFSAFRPRSTANSELGSVTSEYGEPSQVPSETSTARRHASSSTRSTASGASRFRPPSLTDRLSEAGSSLSMLDAPSSSRISSRPGTETRGFRSTLPSVGEALSEAGSTLSSRHAALAESLNQLSMLSEEERESDPRFSELVSTVGSLLDARTQAPSVRRQPASRTSTVRSGQSTLVPTPPSVASTTRTAPSEESTRGIRNWPRHRHPFTADPDTLSLPPSEPARSYTETLERRIARRRRTRPNLASQIPRSTGS